MFDVRLKNVIRVKWPPFKQIILLTFSNYNLRVHLTHFFITKLDNYLMGHKVSSFSGNCYTFVSPHYFSFIISRHDD